MSALVLATVRGKLADYVAAIVTVYWIIIFSYVLTRMFFQLGGRIPYARWSSALLGFLADVSEPYLRLFRRFLPSFGAIDLSPLVGLLFLGVVGGIVAGAIRG
jgi:YggT family protein